MLLARQLNPKINFEDINIIFIFDFILLIIIKKYI